MSGENGGNLRRVLKSKTIGEALDNTTYGMIETIALIPAFLFFTVYICGYKRNFIPSEMRSVDYSVPFHYAFRDTCIPALAVSVIALFFYAAKKRREGRAKSFVSFFKENISLAFFAVFYLLVIISSAAHGFPYAYDSYPYRGESMFTIICYCAAYMMPMTIIRSENRRRTVVYTFMIFGIIMGISMLIKRFYFGLFEGNFCGIFSQFNHYAYFLTIMISASAVLMLMEKSVPLRIISAVSFAFSTVLLVINDTFGGQLSTIAALILVPIMISLVKGKFTPSALLPLVLYLIIMVVSTLIYSGNFGSFSTFGSDVTHIATGNTTGNEGTLRLKMWVYTVEKIKESPLLGKGLEGITDEMGNNPEFINNRPHNEYLQHAVFFGIPAAAAYTLGCLFVFIRGLKLKGHLDGTHIACYAGAFAYLVSAFVGNTMYYTTPFFFMIMGLAYAVHAPDTEDKSDK